VNHYLSQIIPDVARFANVQAKSIGKISELQSPGSVKQVFIKFINAVENELGIRLLVFSGQRSFEHQAILYQKYLEGGNIAAPPGNSWHNYGRAIDFVPVDSSGKQIWNTSDATWKQISDIAKKYTLHSGYAFGDPQHVSYRRGTTIEKLKARQEDPGADSQFNWKPILYTGLAGLGLLAIFELTKRRS